MTVSDSDLKFVSALVFGTIVVLLNTFPFVFRIISKTKEARESDNFNFFIVIMNSYFFLVAIVVAVATTIHIIDLMDILKYLNLLGDGGVFSIFWTTGINTSTTISSTATFLISWIRTLYEWLALISAFLLMIFGFVGGFQYQKKVATKNGQDVDWTSYFAGVVGFFLGVVLLKLYSEVTKYALFVPNNKSIIDVVVSTLRMYMT